MRKNYYNLSQSLSSGFFSDKVVIMLNRLKNTHALLATDMEILNHVEKFFENVLAGYNWSDNPQFSKQAMESATSFSQAVSAVVSTPSIAVFKDYIEELKEIVSKIKNNNFDEASIGKLDDFFYNYSKSELQKTDSIMSSLPSAFAL